MAVADFSLPGWLNVDNTYLIPRAMESGAQVGNIIANNLQRRKEAEIKAQQAAIQFQGFQDYQRDIASGAPPEAAMTRHGAAMFYGTPAYANFLERGTQEKRLATQQSIAADRLAAQAERDAASNLLKGQSLDLREQNLLQKSAFDEKTLAERTRQFDENQARLKDALDKNLEAREKLAKDKQEFDMDKIVAKSLLDFSGNPDVKPGDVRDVPGVPGLKMLWTGKSFQTLKDPSQMTPDSQRLAILAEASMLRLLTDKDIKDTIFAPRVAGMADRLKTLQRENQPAPTEGNTVKKVMVERDGRRFMLPEANLQRAIERGYKVVE